MAFDAPFSQFWRGIFLQATHANDVQAVKKAAVFRLSDIAEYATPAATLGHGRSSHGSAATCVQTGTKEKLPTRRRCFARHCHWHWCKSSLGLGKRRQISTHSFPCRKGFRSTAARAGEC
eukprot:scpid50498/ scgid11541/ 